MELRIKDREVLCALRGRSTLRVTDVRRGRYGTDTMIAETGDALSRSAVHHLARHACVALLHRGGGIFDLVLNPEGERVVRERM